jgi:hypothetical protein
VRRAAGAAVLALAALAPGCGGSGGSGEDAYAGAVNSFCTQVRASLRDFEREAAAAPGGDGPQAARAFGGALAQLSDGIRRSTGTLREADPPDRYAGFTAETVRGFDEAARRLDGVAAAARSGDLGALRDIDRRLGDLAVPAGPPELEARAPACRS